MVSYQSGSEATQLKGMWYFISNHDSTKGKGLNINIINSIHNIKGKTSVNILVSNFSQLNGTNMSLSTRENMYDVWNQPWKTYLQLQNIQICQQQHITLPLGKKDIRKGKARHFQTTSSLTGPTY